MRQIINSALKFIPGNAEIERCVQRGEGNNRYRRIEKVAFQRNKRQDTHALPLGDE